MSLKACRAEKGTQLTYWNLHRPELEPVPAKSPHRKYLVLLAMHLLHSDDPQLICEASDCSERTFHYVKNRLNEHEGVVFNHDRRAKRYVVVQTGVLDLARVAELMRRNYPNRYAYIEELSAKTRASQPKAATTALRHAS